MGTIIEGMVSPQSSRVVEADGPPQKFRMLAGGSRWTAVVLTGALNQSSSLHMDAYFLPIRKNVIVFL